MPGRDRTWTPCRLKQRSARRAQSTRMLEYPRDARSGLVTRSISGHNRGNTESGFEYPRYLEHDSSKPRLCSEWLSLPKHDQASLVRPQHDFEIPQSCCGLLSQPKPLVA